MISPTDPTSPAERDRLPRRWHRAALLLAALLCAAAPRPVESQEAPAGPQEPAPPAADPADVASADAIIAAVYDVISGPAGEARDWERFRSLFRPEARLIPVGPPQGRPDAAPQPFFLSVQDYIEASSPLLEERGFFERELGRVEERFGEIVHAFSSYESRWTRDGEVVQRGINSIQLAWDGERWWVLNIVWRGVGPEEPIPERYLGAPSH